MPPPTEVIGDLVGSSREVSSPTASPRPGQRHEKGPSFPRSNRPTSSGFLDLLTSSSAPDLLALFHARSTPGVSPFRALFLPCSRTPSPAPLPSCRWKEAAIRPGCHWTAHAPKYRAGTAGVPYGRAVETSPPPGLCSTRKSATAGGCLGRHTARGSLGILPSRVFPLIGMARPSTRLPS